MCIFLDYQEKLRQMNSFPTLIKMSMKKYPHSVERVDTELLLRGSPHALHEAIF